MTRDPICPNCGCDRQSYGHQQACLARPAVCPKCYLSVTAAFHRRQCAAGPQEVPTPRARPRPAAVAPSPPPPPRGVVMPEPIVLLLSAPEPRLLLAPVIRPLPVIVKALLPRPRVIAPPPPPPPTPCWFPRIEACPPHRWVIASPNGVTSPAQCKWCGEQRDFYNSTAQQRKLTDPADWGRQKVGTRHRG